MQHHILTIDIVSSKPADDLFDEICGEMNSNDTDVLGLIAATSERCSASATSEEAFDQMLKLLRKHTKALICQHPFFERMRTLTVRLTKRRR